jgi:hypothetical protein
MANNTGLKLINTTSDTITIDLFEQGQSGDNVPIPVIQATSGVEEQQINTSFLSTAIDNPWYSLISAIDLPLIFTSYPTSSIAIGNQVGQRYLVFDDDNISGSFSAGATLEEVSNEIITEFGLKNGVVGSDYISVTPTLELKRIIDAIFSKINFIINYKVPTSSIPFLIKEIRFSTFA